MLNIFVWVLFGSMTGFLASRFIRRGEVQTAPLMVLGVIGAVVGGALGMIIGAQANPSPNLISIIVSLFGAVALVGIYKNISPQN